MIRKIFYLTIFVLLFKSIDLKAWDSTAAKFYPMRVGNVYVFEKYDLWFVCNLHEVQATYRVEITDHVLKPNGKFYYRFNGWWNLGGIGSPTWMYQRIDSNSMNVLSYDSSTNNEFLLDSLLGRVNTYFSCERLNYIQPFGWYERIDSGTFFNSFRHKRQFQCRGPIVAGIYYYLLEGIGFTGYSICELGTGEEHKLRGCVIDGVVYGDTTLTGTSQISTSIPDNYSLSQNYPNPFNPSTIINYSIPSNVKRQMLNVKLTIYNSIGSEVAALVNQKQNPGSYKVEFNGENLPSGIYFYKLESGDFVETKRMILLK